ncbi:EscU/YscU/HrcU family type III secretion system export apparatus switch protein [Leptospirillum ferriphilum]|jgi:flagellar biosynthesis protein FlhB|uniref:EscU/YscU/HrcU family type III secretion system export apparatus switch protein n=1 Tax=Leptospirillum ferriphilum TaxID=178606 RepID=UPI003EE4B937
MRTPENKGSIAIALGYHPEEDDAPVVLAAGQDEIARKILEIAAEYRIPVRSSPRLAEFLIRVPPGHPIPAELYQAVALLLAYLYRSAEPGEFSPPPPGGR